MRTACVFVPSFTIAVERRADPRLNDRAVVVYQQNKVIDASPEVGGLIRPRAPGSSKSEKNQAWTAGGARQREQGSMWGTLRQAKALAPHAVFLEANVSLYRDVSAAMLDALERVAPLVEDAGLGVACADISGLDGHYCDEFELAGALVSAVRDATALLPSAGIAEGKFVAWVAASASPPGDAGIVPSGRERGFLRDKPVGLLPFGPELAERLELLALPLLGDVAALPRTSVEAQFRGIGGRLWELANGIDREALRARRPDEMLDERVNFESPVVATEALTMAGRQIIVRLVRRLRGRTARRMHVRLLADERVVWEKLETFREPTGAEARMLLLLKTRLATLELPQSVDAVAITLSGIGWEVAKQTKLFTESKQNLDQIAEAVRQLRTRYGRPVVWRIEEVDPWSRHPEERRALVPYDA